MKKSMMKKLVVLFAVMVVAGGFVFGDTSDSAVVDLKGSVTPFVSITGGGTLALGDLAFDSDVVDTIVLTERSNKAGYDVTLTSDNGGYLKLVGSSSEDPGASPEEFIPYQAKYDLADNLDSASALDLSGQALVTDGAGRTTGAGVDKTFQVTAQADESDYAGDYEDTLTFTITAN